VNQSVEKLHCSFCRKGQDQVAKLISSPAGASRSYICNECIAVCNKILGPEGGERPEVQQRIGWRDLGDRLHRLFRPKMRDGSWRKSYAWLD